MVELTQEVINDLFDIYREVAGCTWARYPLLEDVKSSLEEFNVFEYRAGSKWSGHSKFIINPSSIYFYPNCDPHGKREKKQIEKAEKEFERRVNEYIASLEKQD